MILSQKFDSSNQRDICHFSFSGFFLKERFTLPSTLITSVGLKTIVRLKLLTTLAVRESCVDKIMLFQIKSSLCTF